MDDAPGVPTSEEHERLMQLADEQRHEIAALRAERDRYVAALRQIARAASDPLPATLREASDCAATALALDP